MAAQQVQIAETIRAMKIALRRQRAASPADSSEDDESDIRTHTNRGHKLSAQAQDVREGRLDSTGGLAFKRKVSHAGYERYIINKRPKLYDEDGDLIDPYDGASEADDYDQPHGDPRQEDAFGEVQLEHLLKPLTSAAELPEHPSLSVAYTSKALTQMAEEAAEMVRREKASLWNAKRLLERFRGDGGWMGCGRFETDHDHALLQNGEDTEGTIQSAVPSITMDQSLPEIGDAGRLDNEALPNGGLQTVQLLEAKAEALANNVDTQDHTDNTHSDAAAANGANGTAASMPAGTQSQENTAADGPAGAAPVNASLLSLQQEENSEQETGSASTNNGPSHAMTTRARARSPQLPASPSPSPSDSASVPAIHPWFLTPLSSLTDRDLGLPPNEAEETRKLLLLYVQKQENVVRQLESLYNGLQKVERLRKEVYRACKAEGHLVPDGKGNMVTEMSDGEDWYDPEDWGLKPWELRDGKHLEKGKDEVEDLVEEEGRRVGGRRRRVVGR